MPIDRRSPASATILKWISITVGIFSIVGVLVGAAISYGQHLRADSEQDARIVMIEQRITLIEARVRDLELANTYLHGDVGLLPHAPKGTVKR